VPIIELRGPGHHTPTLFCSRVTRDVEAVQSEHHRLVDTGYHRDHFWCRYPSANLDLAHSLLDRAPGVGIPADEEAVSAVNEPGLLSGEHRHFHCFESCIVLLLGPWPEFWDEAPASYYL
jgi:hypothetical protein